MVYTKQKWNVEMYNRMSYILWNPLVYFFPIVSCQMCPQRTWLRGCKVTLVAFVWLFSSVYFQMCHQIACLRFVANRVFPLSSLLLFMTMMITMLRMRMMVKSWHLSSVSLTRIKTKRSRGLSLCQVSVMLKESLLKHFCFLLLNVSKWCLCQYLHKIITCL